MFIDQNDDGTNFRTTLPNLFLKDIELSCLFVETFLTSLNTEIIFGSWSLGQYILVEAQGDNLKPCHLN